MTPVFVDALKGQDEMSHCKRKIHTQSEGRKKTTQFYIFFKMEIFVFKEVYEVVMLISESS